MASFYLQVEAINLNDFIFDTDDLSTRRGGSLMLLEAVKTVTGTFKSKWPGNLTVIQEGASVGMYRLDEPHDATAAVIEKVAKDAAEAAAPHATFGVACLPATGNDAAAFQGDRQSLRAKIRWDQMQNLRLTVPAWNDSADRGPCWFDTVRPASKKIWKGEQKPASEAVYDKHEKGRTAKNNFYKDETGLSLKNVIFAQDLDDLTADPSQANLHHKMALIYIDGNSFGEKYDQAAASPPSGKTPWQAYADASQTLVKKRREMLAALLKKMASDSGWRNGDAYRIETLLWGGDEILWVVPAWKGWETLQHFYTYAKDWKIDTETVTHAAGLVFCHHNAPIQRMIDLVHGLCEAAKARDRQKNLIAFQVLESFDFMGKDLDGFRKALLPGREKDLFLDADAMSKVSAAFEGVKGAVPRKQVYRAVQAAHEGVTTDEEKKDLNDLFTGLNKGAEEAAKEAGASLADLKACLGSWDDVFWYHARELWDYIPKPATSSAGKGVAP